MAGMEMDWTQTVFGGLWGFLAACGVIFLCNLIYVLLGFGAGMLAVGMLAALFPDIRDVVVILLVLVFPAEGWIVARSREHIRWKGVGLILLGVAVGVPLGSWALGSWDTAWLLTALSLFLLLAGATFLFLPEEARLRWPRGTAPSVGLASGFLSGLFGTSGPPLAVYFHLGPWDKREFRGHMMAVFLAMTAVRVPTYVLMGLFTGQRLVSGLMLLPAAIVGAVAGQHLHVRIPERAFRRAVALGLLALGGLLLRRSLFPGA
jgi:uncharacterized membrane protein YfcA